jgi:hypothetical protein
VRPIDGIKLACGVAAVVVPVVLLKTIVPRASERLLRFELGPNYKTVQRGPFTFQSDLPPEQLARLGARLEAYCRALGERWGERLLFARIEPRHGVLVIVCSNVADFEKRRDKQDVGMHAGAYYSRMSRTIVMPYGGADMDLSTAFHEATHLVGDLGGQSGALWLREGLASYFEGSHVEADARGEVSVQLGGPGDSHLASFLHGRNVPTVAELLAASPAEMSGEADAFDPKAQRKAGERMGGLYATAACLVGFLAERSPDALAEVVREEKSGHEIGPAWLARKLECKPEDLDARVRAWALERETERRLRPARRPDAPAAGPR